MCLNFRWPFSWRFNLFFVNLFTGPLMAGVADSGTQNDKGFIALVMDLIQASLAGTDSKSGQ